MDLNAEELAMLEGESGPTVQKAMQTLVEYGEVFGAKRLLPLSGGGHIVLSNGMPLFRPYFSIIEQCMEAGLKCGAPFTVNPRPIDHQNIRAGTLEKIADKAMYLNQKSYERLLAGLGLQSDRSFSCACYLDEVNNIPAESAVIAWAESSAVVYANSVLGARTNRNSSGIDIISNLLGKTPEFGLVTDEGRKADWFISIRCSQLPDPQLLGSAIGLKVGGEVPYIIGLKELFAGMDTRGINDFLKEMGAASASNGAVGLFHVEEATPDARKHQRELLNKEYREYTIDESELRNIYNSYPSLWPTSKSTPDICFIGCPHLSFREVTDWVEKISSALKSRGLQRVKTETVLCTAPGVIEVFRETELSRVLRQLGVKTSAVCPLMHLSNPLRRKKAVVTNSSKLRTYTSARFFVEEDLLNILCTGITN